MVQDTVESEWLDNCLWLGGVCWDPGHCPQTAYVGLQFKYQCVQPVTDNIGGQFASAEAALEECFIPVLFGDNAGENWRLLCRLPVTLCGLTQPHHNDQPELDIFISGLQPPHLSAPSSNSLLSRDTPQLDKGG